MTDHFQKCILRNTFGIEDDNAGLCIVERGVGHPPVGPPVHFGEIVAFTVDPDREVDETGEAGA